MRSVLGRLPHWFEKKMRTKITLFIFSEVHENFQNLEDVTFSLKTPERRMLSAIFIFLKIKKMCFFSEITAKSDSKKF